MGELDQLQPDSASPASASETTSAATARDPLNPANGQASGHSEVETSQTCAALRQCYTTFTRPCLTQTHPLPENAGVARRCLDNFLCPPHSRAGAALFVLCVFAAGWATLYSMTGESALPGGNLYSLLVLFIACWCGGYVVGKLKLPPLLGKWHICLPVLCLFL